MTKLDKIKKILINMFSEKNLTGDYGFKFDFNKEIYKISYATNLTPFTINKAIELNADLLITHHDAWPFMEKQREYCYKLLIDNKLNHCFFHTPLDAAEFGTSSSLASAIGLKNKKFTVPYNDLLVGIVGDIEEQSFESLVKKCENVLNEKVRYFKNNGNLCSKILVIAGGGNETKYLDSAINENCDTYFTGEYAMYLQHYAQFHNKNLIIGSHTRTEILGVRSLVGKLVSYFNDIKIFEISELSY